MEKPDAAQSYSAYVDVKYRVSYDNTVYEQLRRFKKISMAIVGKIYMTMGTCHFILDVKARDKETLEDFVKRTIRSMSGVLEADIMDNTPGERLEDELEESEYTHVI